MTQCVPDANVAAKWFVLDPTEELQAEAGKLLAAHTEGALVFAVPDVFWAEFTNVMLKATRQGRISSDEARGSLQSLRALTFNTMASEPLLETALSIALAFRCGLHDCIYVALAQSLRWPLITADKRLVNSLEKVFDVKWLGMLN